MGEKKEGIWKEIFDGDGIRGLMRELTREERGGNRAYSGVGRNDGFGPWLWGQLEESMPRSVKRSRPKGAMGAPINPIGERGRSNC